MVPQVVQIIRGLIVPHLRTVGKESGNGKCLVRQERTRGFRCLLLLCFLTWPLYAEESSPGQLQFVQDPSIEKRIDAMSPMEKIGQLLFVGFPGTNAAEELAPMLAEWNVGGVVLYRWNIESDEQLRGLTEEIRKRSKTAPFIGVDEEGGNVHRVNASAPWLPTAMALGATRSPDLARRAGRELAESLSSLGLTMNFAPVVDVATNPGSTLTVRLISDRPSLVASIGRAFQEGISQGGMVSVPKHFPGIGDAGGDSHSLLVSSHATLDTLRQRELVPWRTLIAGGVEAVMTGHASFPAIDPSGTAATLSSTLLTKLLREEMRFGGIVITDELVMRGLGKAERGKVALESFMAGADMLMVVGGHRDRFLVFSALMRAYEKKTFSEERLRQSLRRILTVKQKHHFPGAAARQVARAGPSTKISDDIAEASVTLLRNRGSILPLRSSMKNGVTYLGEPGPLASRFRRVKPLGPAIGIRGGAPSASTPKLAIIAVSTRDQLKSAATFHSEHPETRIVLVLLGSPIELRPDFQPDALIVTYGSGEAVQRAAGKLLFGELCGVGKMPVTVPGLAKFGDGLSLCKGKTTVAARPEPRARLRFSSGP